MTETIRITIKTGKGQQEIYANKGANLRMILLEHQLEPLNSMFDESDHCEGTGLCAECGVWIEKYDPKENRLRGYAKLSCETIVLEPITINLVPDWVLDRNQKNVRKESN